MSKQDEKLLGAAMNQEFSGGTVRRTSGGIGVIFWMLLIGVLLVVGLTYLPGQLDPHYIGSGQVIGMVNPSGQNPDVDMQYSQINQGNANANLTNARAYQRQSAVWFGFVFGFALVGIVIWILQRAVTK